MIFNVREFDQKHRRGYDVDQKSYRCPWILMRLLLQQGKAERLGPLLVLGLICLSAFEVQAMDTVCQKKAETLGWAICCGCLKHDLESVQRTLHLLLPECTPDQVGDMASHVSDGAEDCANHDEHHFICAMTCKAMDWYSINEHIKHNNDEEPI